MNILIQIGNRLKTLLAKSQILLELMVLPFLFIIAFFCRFINKSIDIGIGPEPFITHIYHQQALKKLGYSVETFVFITYFITNKFDIDASTFATKSKLLKRLYIYFISLSRYKIIYTYFTGVALIYTKILYKFEPWLFKIAGTKIVVMPYGADVQDFRLCNNLHFINATAKDYPLFQKSRVHHIKSNVTRWINKADHVISGCDWVEYMYYWDTLTLSHLPIDTDNLVPHSKNNLNRSSQNIKILHCPNHTNIKGTHHFKKAINELQAEGYHVELVIVQNVPNNEILELMQQVDIIADQLIIGWYAMTAIEAMCLEKPVLCYLKPSLVELYEEAGILTDNEIPLVNCTYKNVKEKIQFLLDNPAERLAIGKKGREFVIKHHSLENIGRIFSRINKSLGLMSSNP